MDLYIDTEFNGFGGALMSMAVVSADGHEWYETLPLPADIDPWVAANVVPVLDKPPVDRIQFNRSLFVFLARFPDIHVYADWYTDLVHFFDSFAGPNHGSSFHRACDATLLKTVPELAPEMPHNALSDARALRDWHVETFQDRT